MKKIKSYSNIWTVEKVIYAVNDLKLPFPVTLSQMAFFVCFVLGMVVLGNMPPLMFVENVLLKYLVIPVGLTVLMSKKTFDGKKPLGFLRSVICYFFRPKCTYAGKPVQFGKHTSHPIITAVRSEIDAQISLSHEIY